MDITARLRRWTHAPDAMPASDLMDEAAALVKSLRREVREQRREIAALRDERSAWIAAERPAVSLDVTDDPARAVDSPSDPVADAAKSVETGDIPQEWLSRPYWVDPPSGWLYGFPRLYDPATDGDMTAWMIAHGYPERLARQGLPCTFTQAGDGETV